MKKWILYMMVMTLSPGFIVGQGYSAGAESASLAGITVVLENPWSAVGNPAGLAGFNHLTLNTSLEQRYLMKETSNYALAATFPVRKGTIGLFGSYAGYRAFHMSRLTLAYGMQFSGKISGGVSLDYFIQSAGNESPSIHQVSFSIGTLIKLSERLSLAFHAFNPFQAYFKSQTYASLCSVYKIGMAYQPSPTLAFIVEVEKDLDYEPVFKAGFEYSIREEFYLGAGLQLFPASYSLGAGYLVRKLLIGIATAYHQYLGFTPEVSIQYLIK